jgi:hypothetical protein
MAFLFPLRTQGAGTSEIEALSSYLIRLAHAHATSVGTLLATTFSHFPTAILESGKGYATSLVSVFIRPNRTTAAIVDVLSRASGMRPAALEPMTFLSLEDALGRGMHMYSSRMRWCPACLSEARAAGDEPYLKLKWQVLSEHTCDIHHLRLRDLCQHCGRRQDSYRGRADIRICVGCFGPLDVVVRSDLSSHYSGTDIRDLVAAVAQREGYRFPKGATQNVLRDVWDEARRIDQEEELFNLIPRNIYVRYMSGNDTVTLQSAMRIAATLSVPLLDLLEGQLSGTTRQLTLDRIIHSPFSNEPKPKRRLEPEQLRQAVERALLDVCEEEAPSLLSLAKRVGVSLGALRYHLPDTLRRISIRFNWVRKDRFRTKRQEAKSAAYTKLRSHQRKRRSIPSAKQLLRELRAETDLPTHLLRDAVRDELARLIKF